MFRPSGSLWFRRTLLGCNLSMPVALFLTGFNVPWLIALAVIVHGTLFYAMVAPGCAFLGPVATRFQTHANEVWLTIDDGPFGGASEELAAELQRRGVRATFFVKGKKLTEHAESARRVLEAGHTLANHTQTHPAHFFYWLPL